MRKKTIKGIILIGGGLVALSVILSDAKPTPATTPATTATAEPTPTPVSIEKKKVVGFTEWTARTKANAWIVCQAAVERRLRSPGTAEFPWIWKVEFGTTKTKIPALQSYVDAQNGFGALIRTNFVCEFAVTGDESDLGSWHASNVSLSDR